MLPPGRQKHRTWRDVQKTKVRSEYFGHIVRHAENDTIEETMLWNHGILKKRQAPDCIVHGRIGQRLDRHDTVEQALRSTAASR